MIRTDGMVSIFISKNIVKNTIMPFSLWVDTISNVQYAGGLVDVQMYYDNTNLPTLSPTATPTRQPTLSMDPSFRPTSTPSMQPSGEKASGLPTSTPSMQPTIRRFIRLVFLVPNRLASPQVNLPFLLQHLPFVLQLYHPFFQLR